ncbi:MAG: hypothetical protein ACLUFM_04760, partial [Lachnospiraceae bacterium]
IPAGNYDGKMSGEYGRDPIDNKDVIQMVRFLSGWKDTLYPEKEYPVAANIRNVYFSSVLKITRGQKKDPDAAVLTSTDELKKFLANVEPDSSLLDELTRKSGEDGFDPEKHRDEICWSNDDIIAEYNEEFFNEHTLFVLRSDDRAYMGYYRLRSFYRKDGTATFELSREDAEIPSGEEVRFYQFIILPKGTLSPHETLILHHFSNERMEGMYPYTHDVALNIGE